jgi:hypothetical protein
VNNLSSHIEVSPASAVVTYNWGDFRHNPTQVLARYFDAYLYWANWGTKRLFFRLPGDLVNEAALEPYLWEYHVELEPEGDAFILQIMPCREDDNDWINEGYTLSGMAWLRDDILLGDYRALYLSWLRSAELDDAAAEETEPPVPPGLRDLTTPLHSLVEFLGLGGYILTAAAQASAPIAVQDVNVDSAITRLTRVECNAYLARLARNEPYLSVALQRRLRQIAGGEAARPRQRRRTWGEIKAAAESLRREAERRRREEAEARRIAALKALAAREKEAWAQVYRLIEEKKPKSYDEAVSLLVQLKDLAVYENRLSGFESRVADIRIMFANRPSLQNRLRTAMVF